MNAPEKENQNKTLRVSRVIEILALASTVFIISLFVLGHITAALYFNSFDIDYFKYADTDTAFQFSIQSTKSIIALVLTLVSITILLSGYFDRTVDEKSNSDLANGFVVMLLVIAIATLFSRHISLSDLKENIANKLYIPYEVMFNQNKNRLYCVTTIGTLGEYQVFVTESLQPILIQSKSITEIKQMFKPFPIEEKGYGQGAFTNPHFEKEVQQWNTKWLESCSGSYDFEIFKFNKMIGKKPP